MRFYEFQDSPIRGEVGALATVLDHLRASKGDGAQISFNELAAAMGNAGYRFDYDNFLDLYNNAPTIKNLIGDHSQDQITLATQTPDTGKPGQEPEDIVGGMAKRAAGSAIQ